MRYIAGVPPPPPSPPPKSASLGSVLSFVMALNTLLGMYTAGAVGMAVVVYSGAGFAQYLWVIRADTPVEPHLPYPVAATVALAVLPLPLVRKRQWQLAGIASIPFAILPFYQLYQLYLAATPTTFE